ncbi:unnamed protein product [Choristocarpus tenellus]
MSTMEMDEFTLPVDLAGITDDVLFTGDDILGFNLEDYTTITSLDTSWSNFQAEDAGADETTAGSEVEAVGEESTYQIPGFFPFCGSTPSSTRLKMAGFPMLKKVNSGFLPSNTMSYKEEADTARELERALYVLSQQKLFLTDQLGHVNTWAESVYKSQGWVPPPSHARVENMGADCDVGIRAPAKTDREHELETDGQQQKEVRVRIKCKGTDKRRTDRPLVALVDETMWPARGRSSQSVIANMNKHTKHELPSSSSGRPFKKTKVHALKPGPVLPVPQPPPPAPQSVEATHESFEEVNSENVSWEDVHAAGQASPATPAHLRIWLDTDPYFKNLSWKEPLPEDLTLESTFSNTYCTRHATTPQSQQKVAAEEAEIIENKRDKSGGGMLMQRLLSALLIPKKGVKNTTTETETNHLVKEADQKWGSKEVVAKNSFGDASKRLGRGLEVAWLTPEQRVSIQLKAVGLLGNTHKEQSATDETSADQDKELQELQAELTRTRNNLNRTKLAIRKRIMEESTLSECEVRKRTERQGLLKDWEELLEKYKARRAQEENAAKAERARMAQRRGMPW